MAEQVASWHKEIDEDARLTGWDGKKKKRRNQVILIAADIILVSTLSRYLQRRIKIPRIRWLPFPRTPRVRPARIHRLGEIR